ESFREIVKAGGVTALEWGAKSPNLNACAERWVRSAKEECVSRLILFSESSVVRAVMTFAEHYHGEREPSRQRKRSAVSGGRSTGWFRRRQSALQGATGRPAEVTTTGRLHEFLDHTG